MSDIDKLRAALGADSDKPLEFKAVMGRADGTVKSIENNVYITLYNGSVIEVYNDRLPRIAWRKIVVGYDPTDPLLLQVLRFDNVYATNPTPMIPNHKESHTWFSYDAIDVYGEQILPLLPRAIGGLVVRVYGGWYQANSAYHIIDTQDLDLSGEAIASGAEWVNAEIDDAGVTTYNHGANYGSRELLLPEYIPTTDPAKKLLFSVKTYAGQVSIIQTRTESDIFDPRMTGVSSGGTATTMDWSGLLNVPAVFPPDTSYTDPLYAPVNSAHVHALARWDAPAGDGTFDYPDAVDSVMNVKINGLVEDEFEYTLSDDGTQLTLSAALPFAAVVSSEYILRTIT